MTLAKEHAGRGQVAGLEGGREPANTLVSVTCRSLRRGRLSNRTSAAVSTSVERAAPTACKRVLELGCAAPRRRCSRGSAPTPESTIRSAASRGTWISRYSSESQSRRIAGSAGSEQARGLVEDAARDAHRPQLGPLAEEGELERIELEAGDRAQRERDRHFEGGGRREPRSRREVGRDRASHSDRGPTCVGELGGHRLHVARPSLYARAAPVGGDGLSASVALGQEHDLVVGGGGGEPDPVLDRDGQDKPAAVVGVLADEVDPPRSPDTVRRRVHIGHGPGHWSENLARSATPRPPRGAAAVSRRVPRRILGAMTIPRIAFGRTRHTSSRVVFGAVALSGATPAESNAVLEVLLQHGVNHIDTAAS